MELKRKFAQNVHNVLDEFPSAFKKFCISVLQPHWTRQTKRFVNEFIYSKILVW